MAGILKRGPRNAPRFYVQFDRGHMPDGKRVRSTRLLKGVENMLQARQEAARVEREVQAGRDPFPEPVIVLLPGATAGPLLRQWAETLKNRNARDDRSRLTRYLLPTFGKTKVEQITLPAVMNRYALGIRAIAPISAPSARAPVPLLLLVYQARARDLEPGQDGAGRQATGGVPGRRPALARR